MSMTKYDKRRKMGIYKKLGIYIKKKKVEKLLKKQGFKGAVMTHEELLEELLKEGWEPDIGGEGFNCELCDSFIGRYEREDKDGGTEYYYTEGYKTWDQAICPKCGQKHTYIEDMRIELSDDQKKLLLKNA